MQKHPGKKLHYFIINLLILSMIGGIYFFSTNQDAQNVIARLTANPISSGNSYEDEIFFLGSYQGDPQTLTDILDAAEKNQVQLTVFTTPQWMEEHADLAKRIANRHCLGIYGEDYQGNWEEAAIREDLRKSCLVYQEIVGKPAKYYMPFHAEYDKQLITCVLDAGMDTILYSKDTRAYSAQDDASFVDQVCQKAQRGDYIYVNLDSRFQRCLGALAEQLSDYRLLPIDTNG